ncbi:MAG: hypothetical protein ACSHYC_07995 [Alphaproteobacteria bacterium]
MRTAEPTKPFGFYAVFAMMFMNGHDAIFMGLVGGPTEAAIAGLAFAVIAAVAIVLVWRKPATE